MAGDRRGDGALRRRRSASGRTTSRRCWPSPPSRSSGYMFLAVGSGAYVAGIFHLVTHAFFKALLFLGAGSVIHAMHHAYHATHCHDDAQDMRNMGGLRQWMPWTFGADVDRHARDRRASRRSPGFFSKDEILGVGVRPRRGAGRCSTCSGASASLAVAAHRVLHGPAHGDDLLRARTAPARRSRRHLHEAPWIMTGPLAVLGLLSVAGGLHQPAALRRRPRLAGALARAGAEAVARAGAARDAATGRPSTRLIGFAVLIGVVGLVLGVRARHAAHRSSTRGRRGARDRVLRRC